MVWEVKSADLSIYRIQRFRRVQQNKIRRNRGTKQFLRIIMGFENIYFGKSQRRAFFDYEPVYRLLRKEHLNCHDSLREFLWLSRKVNVRQCC